MRCKKRSSKVVFLLTIALAMILLSCSKVDEKIGVLFVIHGGQDTSEPQFMWDATIQQFIYDPNHTVYKYIIWNPNPSLNTNFISGLHLIL